MWATMMSSALGAGASTGIGAGAGAGSGAAGSVAMSPAGYAGTGGSGGILSDALGFGAMNKLMDFGLGEISAAKAYKRQKRILKNRIQWAVNDMRVAGLNPVLAAGGVPTGSASAPMAVHSGADLAGQADKAIRARSGKRIIDFLADKMEADIRAVNAQGVRDTATGAAQWQQANAARTQAALNDVTRQVMEKSIPSAQTVADFDRTELGKFLIQMGRALESVLPILGRIGGRGR